MTKKTKSPFDEAREEIELRLGGLLGDLGSALGEALSRLDQNADTDTTKQTRHGPIQASTGIRVRTLGGQPAKTRSQAARDPAKPVNRPASAAQDTASQDTGSQDTGAMNQSPEAEPASRPLEATMFEEAGTWMLTAELPGIAVEDVTLSDTPDGLLIAARTPHRAYQGTVETPAGLTADRIAVRVTNGILQLSAETTAEE